MELIVEEVGLEVELVQVDLVGEGKGVGGGVCEVGG